MKKIINIQHEANIKAEGKLSGGNCKPVICIDTGDVYTSCIDAAEAVGVHFTAMSAHLRGKTRTVHGKRYVYMSRVSEELDAIVTRLRETSSIEEDAKKWQAYQVEQEKIRIAKEKRDAEIAKAKDKVARRQAIRDRIAAQLAEAEQNLMNAEKELEALDDEGKEVA